MISEKLLKKKIDKTAEQIIESLESEGFVITEKAKNDIYLLVKSIVLSTVSLQKEIHMSFAGKAFKDIILEIILTNEDIMPTAVKKYIKSLEKTTGGPVDFKNVARYWRSLIK
ncbi:hypothetical protein [Methanocaldococcus sp.]